MGALVGLGVSGFVLAVQYFNHFWHPSLPKALPAGWALPDYSLGLGAALACSALVAGQILRRLEAGKVHGPAHLLMAIRQDKDLDTRNGFWSVLLAMSNLSGGASVGAFGPNVSLGGLIASVWNEKAKQWGSELSVPRDVLLGAGTAAAVAALMLAPLGGVLFAFEAISRRITAISGVAFGAAAAAGFAVVHLVFGLRSPLPDLSGAGPGGVDTAMAWGLQSAWPAVVVALALGVCVGGLALLYMRAIVHMPAIVQWSGLPLAWQPWVPAALLFLLSPWLSHLLGTGVFSSGLAMTGALSLGLVCALLLAKLVVTPICLGFGLAGGVVGPAIFLGAMLGNLFQVAWPLFSAAAVPHFAVMAAAACVACVIGAPWASVVMMWEMTGDTGATVLSVLCVAAAYGVSRKAFARSLFDWALK
jgi:CIC family chloride channel protein